MRRRKQRQSGRVKLTKEMPSMMCHHFWTLTPRYATIGTRTRKERMETVNRNEAVEKWPRWKTWKTFSLKSISRSFRRRKTEGRMTEAVGLQVRKTALNLIVLTQRLDEHRSKKHQFPFSQDHTHKASLMSSPRTFKRKTSTPKASSTKASDQLKN